MSNTLEGINSRITEAEEWIDDLEDRMVEITAAKQNIRGKIKGSKVPIVKETTKSQQLIIIHMNL